jgi:hypothetical protein
MDDTRSDGLRLASAQREGLAALAEEVEAVAAGVGLETQAAGLAAIAAQVRDERFRVLVVGEFSAGKSTTVNALLGRELLPNLPVETTAVLTEVTDADPDAGVDLIPLDGSAMVHIAADGSFADRLEAAIRVDPTAPNPWAKVIVRWPLPLCRDGVTIVDTPGLNATPEREQLTFDALRTADAVVFVQSSLQAMSATEQAVIEAYLDTKDPLWVFTYIDAVRPRDRPALAQDLAAKLARLRPHHPGDQRRIFFVNALGAMAARDGGDLDQAELDRSGFAEFEAALIDLLVRDAQRMKVLSPARDLLVAIIRLRGGIPAQLALLDLEVGDLTAKVGQARLRLDDQQRRAEVALDALRLALDDAARWAEDQVECWLHDQAAARPVAAAEVQTTTHLKIDVRPKVLEGQKQEIAEQVAAEFSRHIRDMFKTYCHDQLAAGLVVRLEAAAHDVGTAVDELHQELEDIVDVTGPGLPGATNAAGVTARAVFGGVLGGPVAIFAGSTVGARAAVLSSMPMAVLGALAAFTPVGMGALAVSMASQVAITMVLKDKTERKLKEEVLAGLHLDLAARARSTAARFGEDLRQQIGQWTAAAEGALLAPVAARREELASAMEVAASDERAVATHRAALLACDAALAAHEAEARDLVGRLEAAPLPPPPVPGPTR